MAAALEKHTHHFVCMTSPCEIILYAKNKNQAMRVASEIENNTRRLEDKYNFFNKNSCLSKINNRTEDRVKIDEETLSVLRQVREMSVKTQGKFDITVGTLKQCEKLESVKEIESCRTRLKCLIGPDSWSLSEGFVHFKNTRVKIDLGGVIKEYAVDQAAIIAATAGLSALINFGGDIYVNGRKPDGSLFNVAIKNPKDTSQNIAILKLSDQGLTTSAHYERSTMVEGKSYSHIIGGDNADISILSATVISDSVLVSGIWSTSLMIKPDLAVDNDISVVLIDESLRLHQHIGTPESH